MHQRQRSRRQFLQTVPQRHSADLALEQLEVRRLLTAVPNGFEHERIVTGIAYPKAMEFAPDGRIFVAEKTGTVRIVKDGVVLPQPFATVDTLSDVEFGLVGLVLDPEFTSNGYVYVNYTTTATPPRNVIERFTAVGDVAATGSRQTIFQLDTLDPNARNHVGGAMHFGVDGMLYVATGDNNRPWDSPGLGSIHGKMLRIERTGDIPADNPFYDSLTGRNRAIWAYGLRNPFTFGIDSRSGTVLINDVGYNRWEEIKEARQNKSLKLALVRAAISFIVAACQMGSLFTGFKQSSRILSTTWTSERGGVGLPPRRVRLGAAE